MRERFVTDTFDVDLSKLERVAYSVDEAASLLGVRADLFRLWVRQRLIPLIRVGNGEYVPAGWLERRMKYGDLACYIRLALALRRVRMSKAVNGRVAPDVEVCARQAVDGALCFLANHAENGSGEDIDVPEDVVRMVSEVTDALRR